MHLNLKTPARLAALMGGALLASCGTPSSVSDGPNLNLVCGGVDQEIERRTERVNAALADVTVPADVLASYTTHRDALASAAKALCSGGAPGTEMVSRAQCARNGADALSALERVLTLYKDSTPDPREVAWVVEAKVLQLEDAALCETAAAISMGDVKLSARGAFKKGGVFLQPAVGGGAPTAEPLELTAKLVCQRKTASGAMEDLPNCNHAEVHDRDNFQVDFETNVPAHVYLLMYNGSGQFQTLFPDPEVPNQVGARTQYILPAPDDWWRFDTTSDVLEHIQLVASVHPVAELEKLRGMDIPGGEQQKPPRAAMRARGKMEPLIARGFKNEGGEEKVIQPDGESRPGADLNVSGEDVVAVEFVVEHLP